MVFANKDTRSRRSPGGALPWLLSFVAAVIAGGTAAQAPGAQPLDLTTREQAWIDAHPVIRVAAVPDWPPFDFVDTGGEYRGINADLLRRLGDMAGFRIEPVTGPWPALYEQLQAGDIRLCAGMQASEARREHLRFTDPVFRFPHAIYTRTDTLGIARLEDLYGKTVAVEQDYYEHEYLQKHHPEIALRTVDNALEALFAVSRGDAAAYIGNVAVASYLINENVISDIEMGPYANIGPLELSIGVHRDHPLLVDILNKALAALSPAEKRAIVEDYVTTPEAVALTAAEQAWIREHPVIRLGIDPEFAPFEYIGRDGAYRGMASDFIGLLNRRLGLNMEVVHTTSWKEAVALARAGELDVLPCLARNDEREEFLHFTRPYLSYHRVFITRLDSPYVGRLDDLTGMHVAVQRDTSHHGFIREETELDPVLHDTFQEALTAVARGEADAAIGNAATTAYWLKQLGLGNLRLAVPVSQGVEKLHFGVRKDWPELAAILNKGLEAIPEEEVLAIRRKWVDVDVRSGFDLRRVAGLVAAVIAVFIPILLLIGFHNRRLQKEVTARHRMETALRDSEENYRTLVENANSIILRMAPGGTVLFLNRYGEEFFGYPADDIVGTNILDTIVPDRDTQGRDLRERMAKLGEAPEQYAVHENENMTRDGRRVWIAWTNCPLYDGNGNLQEILCVGNDVTAQRRTANTLRRYEFIVNTVRAMMSVIDSDARYEAVNDEWCAATGVPREQATGKSVEAVWGNEVTEEAILPRLKRCLDGQRVAYEASLDLPGEAKGIYDITMYPFTDGSDGKPRAIVVAQNITARKTAELKLQDAMHAAEAGNRAKSAFLANMSHEIRTPLNAVLGYTQLLQRTRGLSPDQVHALDAIRRSGDHLLSLISDILEISRIEAGHVDLDLVTFNLQSMLNDLDVMFRVRTDAKGILLTVDTASDLPPCLRGDLNRIKQVLINLIGNAVKFTDAGRITVRTGLAESTSLPDDRLVLQFDIEDTGPGIPPEAVESIFGSFNQTGVRDGSGEGTGLGLTISRNFARLLDGDVTLRSEVGKGSCFTFTASVQRGRPGDVEEVLPPRRAAALHQRSQGCRVLVVDDRETNRDLLCRMLSTLGFETRTACDGEEGVAGVETWRPEVVLLDLVMPVVDGREAIRRIRALPPGFPQPCIVALTASTLAEEREVVLELGADAFLRKPFQEDELLEELHRHAGVEYVYEDNEPDSDSGDGNGDGRRSLAEAREAVAALPPELSTELRAIVRRGAINEAAALLPRLQQEDKALAHLVQRCTEGYVLDELRTLWEGNQAP